ncbi:MAG: nucleotidyltransferase domain-containing protein [Candidatus Aenigmarchaeota archaeon]|nr:nucleotidyltransferase domain-containing protein [Candidatus Aenigmarchaeota archaeon]MBI4177617.1 nucleotidyltransferase domain-containing protein [Candidatus Aenigmarchaeota archaeon]
MFLRKVKKKFAPSKVILFGSRARGDYLIDSDYDLLIVSDKFSKYDWHQRMVEVIKLTEGKFSLDVICLTEEEFEKRKKELSIVNEAVKEGVVLKV